MVQSFSGAAAMLFEQAPAQPVVCFRPHMIAARARSTLQLFPGDVLYAVKCNDHPVILEHLHRGGIRHFDTASIAEIRLVRSMFDDVSCHFMHPVKSPEAIAEAYFEHDVRRFVLDHPTELAKILEATGNATDLELFVRVCVPGDGAVLTLTGKFGTGPEEAAALLIEARRHAAAVGLTFHVGSQCLAPQAFDRAIRIAAQVADAAGGIDHLDVGGGFPAAYAGDEPAFAEFVKVIRTAVQRHGLQCRLQCEPGRQLVADGASVIARVELRRGNRLYLNDGVYGNLAELKWLGPLFPIRVHAGRGVRTGEQIDFDLFGPTCDSIDSMPGPHTIAGDVAEGDWIEVGMMGAYSTALRTGFNGFAETGYALLDEDVWHAIEPAHATERVAA